jgi:hypothetical protein
MAFLLDNFSGFGGLSFNSNSPGPTGTTGATGDTGAVGPPGAPPSVYQATYYKSAAQNLASGTTIITFNSTGAWNNPGGYITQRNATDFTVVNTGLYQLEFNGSVAANGTAYTTASSKVIAINVIRGVLPSLSIAANTALQASLARYTQSVSASYYLVAGDIINLIIINTYGVTPTPPTLLGVQDTFDLNSYFSWRFIT